MRAQLAVTDGREEAMEWRRSSEAPHRLPIAWPLLPPALAAVPDQ